MNAQNSERENRARAAAQKQQRGEPLKREERRDLDWWKNQQRMKLGEEYLLALPKGIYCKYAGKQQKIVDDQARKWGIPILSSDVNITAVIAWIHAFLVANATRLSVAGDADDLKKQKLQRQIEKLERERDLLDCDISERHQKYISRAELADRLAWLVNLLKQFGERGQQKFGPDFGLMFNDALDNLRISLEVTDGTKRVDSEAAEGSKAGSKKPSKNVRRRKKRP